MKKVLPGVLVVIALTAAAFFVLKARRHTPEHPRGAELAPPETIFFAHLPSVRKSAQRFPLTNLYHLWQEPEMQAFLEKPRQSWPDFGKWQAHLDRLRRLDPGEAFVAVTGINGVQPEFVAGISFGGSKVDAEALANELRREFRKGVTGKAGVIAYKANEIETFTEGGSVLAECFRDQWYFVSNKVALLEATLDRHASPAGSVAGTLAGGAVFARSVLPLGNDPDFLAFAQVAPLSDRLGPLIKAAEPEAQELSGLANAKAVSFATKLERAHIRDTLFILSPGQAKPAALSQRTLGFSSPETFFYYDFALPANFEVAQALNALGGFVPAIAELEKTLNAQGATWKEAGQAFGPELGTLLEWPEESPTPAVLLALEVRDGAAARKFVEALTSGGAPNLAWTRNEQGGAAIYQSPPTGSPFAQQPVLALTEKFLVFGMSQELLRAALARRNSDAPGLAQSHPFQQSASRMSAPTSGFAYLDTRAAFERIYRVARPFLTMSLVFSPEAANYVDAGRLPSWEAISRHLGPAVLSQSTSEEGILLESTGPLTFSQILLGGAGGTVAATFPALRQSFSAPAPPSVSQSTVPRAGHAKDVSSPLSEAPAEPVSSATDELSNP